MKGKALNKEISEAMKGRNAVNEEIKKNEISEEQLEGVAGGSGFAGTCPRCGGEMINEKAWLRCKSCSSRVEKLTVPLCSP